jgi:hypothetical protein
MMTKDHRLPLVSAALSVISSSVLRRPRNVLARHAPVPAAILLAWHVGTTRSAALSLRQLRALYAMDSSAVPRSAAVQTWLAPPNVATPSATPARSMESEAKGLPCALFAQRW